MQSHCSSGDLKLVQGSANRGPRWCLAPSSTSVSNEATQTKCLNERFSSQTSRLDSIDGKPQSNVDLRALPIGLFNTQTLSDVSRPEGGVVLLFQSGRRIRRSAYSLIVTEKSEHSIVYGKCACRRSGVKGQKVFINRNPRVLIERILIRGRILLQAFHQFSIKSALWSCASYGALSSVFCVFVLRENSVEREFC